MSGASFLVAVAVVVIHRGRVLALRRAATKDVGSGIWETVSGRLELGESLEAAVQRELREETGVEHAAPRGPIDAYVMKRGERPMCVVVYAAEVDEDAVTCSAEHDAHAWLTLDEAKERMPARLADAVARALR